MNQTEERSPALPPVVSAEEWQRSRDELMTLEKQATRSLDALAARRRRLPMVPFHDYEFRTADGTVTLRQLFGDNRQLAIYQFMDAGPGEFCPGCTAFTRNVADLDMLAQNDLSWATVSQMPIEQIEQLRSREGWTMPFVSSLGTTFAEDCGADSFMFVDVPARRRRHVSHVLDGLAWRRPSAVHETAFVISRRTDEPRTGRTRRREWPQKPTYG